MSDPTRFNPRTQPLKEMPVFSNWKVVARGWYFVMPSRDLKKKKIKSAVVCGQRIAFFRGEDGVVRAIDAYCPHMGVDLALGKVVGRELRCFFHHWQFNGSGQCTKIPASESISPRAKLHSWAVDERYGMIWVFPDEKADHPVPEVMALDGIATRGRPGKILVRKCHHHVNMVNGIDPQHLRTVHQLETEMKMRILEQGSPHVMEYVLDGRQTLKHPFAVLVRWITGGAFSYSMRFVDGSVGCISVNQNVRIRGLGWKIPALHMIFAYRPNKERRVTEVQTLHIVPKSSGWIGYLWDEFLLWITAMIFTIVRDEDGMIYDNIRFRPNALLPMDAPISQYIAYVNRLNPSIWSEDLPEGQDG